MMAGEMKRGLIGELGVHNFAVWCALRSNVNLDGRIYCTIKTLQAQTKMSKPTIIKAIAFLEERHLLQVLRDEKHHRYFVIDQIPYKRIDQEDIAAAVSALNEGAPDGMLAVRYVPKTAARDRADAQNFLVHGQPPNQNPNIQLVANKTNVVMGDQLVVMGDLHVHLPPNETEPARTETIKREHGGFDTAAAMERIRKIQERRLQEAMQDKVLTVKQPNDGGHREK